MKEKQPVAIIGGAGKMGAKTADLFRGLNYEVRVSDTKPGFPTPQEVIVGNEIIFFSIPAKEVNATVIAIRPKITASNNILDNSSTKTEFVNIMRELDEQKNASICLTHPLCGPSIPWEGEKVTLIPVGKNSKNAREIAQELYGAARMEIAVTTLQQEIDTMFNSQSIPHMVQRVVGLLQANRGLSFDSLRKNATPNSELFYGSSGRVWFQDARLSADMIYSALQIKENEHATRMLIKELTFMLEAKTAEEIEERLNQAEHILFQRQGQDSTDVKKEMGEKTGKLIAAQKLIF